MLLVHPSSQCDVCLDPYTWATPEKSPHAIQCGHIFCLDCLRSVNRAKCPLCRKAFNPERIKKLHVDKVNGDGSGLAGPMLEEFELLKQIAVLFDPRTSPEEINALVDSVNAWLSRSLRPTDLSEDHPLRTAVTALHQFQGLHIEKEELKKELGTLRATHERSVTVKDKDIRMAMVVERNMLQASQKAEQEMNALRAENTRLQEELRRYTHSSNPLPRPPELNPIVSNILATSQAGLQDAAVIPPLPPGFLPSGAVAAAAGNTQAQGSSDHPRRDTIQVIPPPPAPGERSKYRVTSTGEEMRQENRRRPHLIVPGAIPSARVLPRHVDNDSTPRASAAVPIPPATGLSMWAGEDWPFDYTDCRPRQGEPAGWGGVQDNLRATVQNQIITNYGPTGGPGGFPSQSLPLAAATQSGPGVAAPPPPPAPVELATAHMPYMPRDARLLVERHNPRASSHWHPGPAPGPKYAQAYVPGHGIKWVTQKQADKMPIRARGTDSRHPYVIAKDPSELVDQVWKGVGVRPGSSPVPNPLQLSGVPEEVIAGPSHTIIQREDEEAMFSTAREGSGLFRNLQDASGRPASIEAVAGPSIPMDSSRPGMPGFQSTTQRDTGGLLRFVPQAEPGQSTTARPAVQTQPPEELPDPSPAPSWGGSSRRSSLPLQLNNLPTPHGSEGLSGSVDQLSIPEFVGLGPAPAAVAVDTASISNRSEGSRGGPLSGLLLNTNSRESSSRQVVTGLQDLEDINRSLRQVGDSQSDTRSSRSSASRHISERDSNAHIGPRTGLALYASRPPTHYSGSYSSAEIPSNPAPAPHARPQSRNSTGSHADSIHSLSATSQHDSGSGPRARRSSTASSVHFNDQMGMSSTARPAEPSHSQSYAPIVEPYSDGRSQGSHESIPRSMGSMGLMDSNDGFAATGGLLLSFEAPSTSSAVDSNGQAAAGIHAPRPVSSRHSSRGLFGGSWLLRGSDR
ncbi:hypothetical protein C2E23DRAFT_762103 [Lenzites betulinus]|nr:hypothetical protein C2E23DRAFT_762103 [Lenzites betulinus]